MFGKVPVFSSLCPRFCLCLVPCCINTLMESCILLLIAIWPASSLRLVQTFLPSAFLYLSRSAHLQGFLAGTCLGVRQGVTGHGDHPRAANVKSLAKFQMCPSPPQCSTSLPKLSVIKIKCYKSLINIWLFIGCFVTAILICLPLVMLFPLLLEGPRADDPWSGSNMFLKGTERWILSCWSFLFPGDTELLLIQQTASKSSEEVSPSISWTEIILALQKPHHCCKVLQGLLLSFL